MAANGKKADRPKQDDNRLSLHGLTPEEALKKALSTPAPKPTAKRKPKSPRR